MSSMLKFDTDFVSNTKNIIQNYSGDYDVSNMINCSLGLLIVPYENIKNIPDSFWNTELSQ